jgi:hypothetical protein
LLKGISAVSSPNLLVTGLMLLTARLRNLHCRPFADFTVIFTVVFLRKNTPVNIVFADMTVLYCSIFVLLSLT